MTPLILKIWTTCYDSIQWCKTLLIIVMYGRYGVMHIMTQRNSNLMPLQFATFKSKIWNLFLVEYLHLQYKPSSNGTFQTAGRHWSTYWFLDLKKRTCPKLKPWHLQLLRSEFLTLISIFSSMGICTRRYVCQRVIDKTECSLEIKLNISIGSYGNFYVMIV